MPQKTMIYEIKEMKEQENNKSVSHKYRLIGVIIGAIISAIFLVSILMSNPFSIQNLMFGAIPFIIWIILGLYIGHSIERKHYRTLMVFSIFFIIPIILNLAGPVNEFIYPESTFSEKITIRFDSVNSDNKSYVNYDNPLLDSTAVWNSVYNATVIKDGYVDGVGDKKYFLTKGTKITLEKGDGNISKIYNNYIKTGVEPKLAENYIQQSYGSRTPPIIGENYEVILFSGDGKSFSFQHYVDDKGLTLSQEYGKKTALSNGLFSLVILSTPIYVFTYGFFIWYMFLIMTYGLGLIFIILGLFITNWASKDHVGNIRRIDFLIIFLQYLTCLGTIITLTGILPTW